MTDRRTTDKHTKSPLDVAADLLVFAPVGVALEVGKHLPQLAKQGRDLLEGPIGAAKVFGKLAVDQGRKDLGERLKNVTEPYFGTGTAGPTASRPNATTAEQSSGTAKYEGPSSTDLPIEGYVSLPVVEIVEHLGRLSLTEIESVRSYESAHQNRPAVVDRCDELLHNAGS